MWLFLASEVMFFAGLLAAYVVLRAADPWLFERHQRSFNAWSGTANTLLMLLSSLTMWRAVVAARAGRPRRAGVMLLLTLALAGGFVAVKSVEYAAKLRRATVVAIDPGTKTSVVYDGPTDPAASTGTDLVLTGPRAATPVGFDIHAVSPAEVQALPGVEPPARHRIAVGSINHQVTYGPWKNNVYASYFVLTGAHVIHVLGGMLAISVLAVQTLRGRAGPAHAANVGLYWQFVDAVWLVLFPLLYLT